MPRSPDSMTDTYLDVLRTIGVPDAALRRHHDAGPETPLRVAIDGDRGSPTADLLSALDATGRLLDLRDGLATDDGDRLTATLARFGLRVEGIDVDVGTATDAATDADADADTATDADAHADVDAATDDDAGDGLELVICDDVTGRTERISTAADAETVLATLDAELPGASEIAFVELLDGRHLVADQRELEQLAERYGPRIQPFDDPLLVPDAAIEIEDGDRSAEAAGVTPGSDAGDPAPDESGALGKARPPTPAAEDGDDSFGEFVSAVDDSAVEAVESALADSDPDTHTIEGDGEDVAAASTTSIGGGPRRTTSSSGIDEVFEQLESAAPVDGSTSTTTQTMSESSDPPTGPSTASEDDAGTAGLSGGPTRTVSSTSADDILERATGDSDFETIAAEEGDADPDAVLSDAEDVPPALEETDVAAQLDAGEGRPDSDAEESNAFDAEEPHVTADEQAGAADVPADPAAAADDVEADAASHPTDSGASATDDEASAAADDATAAADSSAVDTDPATDDDTAPDESESATDGDGSPIDEDRSETNEGGSSIDENLHENDVELRRGDEPVETPGAPAAGAIDVDPDEFSDADGPLAAAGGVAQQGGPTVEAASQQTDATPQGGQAEESVESEDDPGLVGRLTSTIFGR